MIRFEIFSILYNLSKDILFLADQYARALYIARSESHGERGEAGEQVRKGICKERVSICIWDRRNPSSPLPIPFPFSNADLRVLFHLSIVALEQQNSAFREQSIRNLLLSEIGMLETYLNRTNLDRSRVSVRTIS